MEGCRVVSIHHNALSSKWHSGTVEMYEFPTASNASRDIVAMVPPRIVIATGWSDRRVQSANFHMFWESKNASNIERSWVSWVDNWLRSDIKLKA